MSVTVPNTFATQSGNVPASELDANFSALVAGFANTLNADNSQGPTQPLIWVQPLTLTPTTGPTLTLNSVPGVSTLQVYGPASTDVNGWHAVDVQASTTTGQSLGMRVRGGTNSNDHSFVAQNAAGTISMFEVFGDTSWGFFRAAFTSSLNGSAAGNVVVSAPTSGVAFTVNGLAAQNALVITSPNTAGQSQGLQIQAGTNSSDYALAVKNAANSITMLGVFGDTSWGFFRAFSVPSLNGTAAGNVAVAAPSSGVALTVTGFAGSYAQLINGASGAGNSNGLHIVAGTNASDFPLSVSNQANSVTYFLIGGDSSWGFFRAAFTPSIASSAAGNITIGSPSSGQTLTVAPSPSAGELIATSSALTTGAGASAGTLTNAPSAGNPTKWIKINDNGTIRSVPAW